MTPTLNSERLVLRELVKATKKHVEWLNDKEVVRYSEQRHVKHTLQSCQKYIWSFGNESHIWAIIKADGDAHIGNITATYNSFNRVAEIGILIGEKSEWGHHYGEEAWRTVSDWLLSTDNGIRKLEAGCMANNIAMRRILDHTGFKIEGQRLNHFLLDGVPVTMTLYGRFR